MTTLSIRRFSTRNVRRNGMTLIEIMSSVMVLAVGLVGVLAAIPFGGFRLSQMNEADYSSAVGRVAVRTIKSNGWANPNNWYLKSTQTGGLLNDVVNPAIKMDSDGGIRLNLAYPFFIDPLNPNNQSYGPTFYPTDSRLWNVNAPFFYSCVSPIVGSSNIQIAVSEGLSERYERAFYLPDDLASGYDVSEDETELRPRLETESDNVMQNGDVPSFSGRYTWMATIYPKSNSEAFFNCRLSDVSSADYDAVVFKDRIPDDERVMNVTLDGSGNQGGTVTLDLSSMLDNSGANASDGLDRARVLEQLETTKYVMLTGVDDIPVDGVFPNFSRWYKIANYSVIGEDDNGDPLTLRLSLIGPDTPASWINGAGNAGTIKALFFPGVVGVYSGSTTF